MAGSGIHTVDTHGVELTGLSRSLIRLGPREIHEIKRSRRLIREVDLANTADLLYALASAPADTSAIGGKGSSLGRLMGFGHLVPAGLVVTTQSFKTAIDQLGLREAVSELDLSIADGRPRHDLADDIFSRLSTSAIPGAVKSMVEAEIERLGLWTMSSGTLIVRSSATVEDSTEFSFAGMFESLVITQPEHLEAAIREVWSSVFSRRAVEYVSQSNAGGTPEMALVLQVFLEATRSGVMFTTFGGDRVLIEHVEGGCEKLVKGEVIPDRLWLDKRSGSADGVSSELEPYLTELASLAAVLETQFGGPQDVEWCIFNGQLHVLQSRPVTAGFENVAVSETESAIVSGVPASPGVGTGEVHLVFNIDHALEHEPGQVLVTPMTNPDMVVAMRNAAGIVTDVGGIICHAAIVSRELGLPCVVGTGSATTALAAGAIVTVDGSSGAVYAGHVLIRDPTGGRPAGDWTHVWARWCERWPLETPAVSSLDALESAPRGMARVVLRPDIDLRSNAQGLWNALEYQPEAERNARVAAYLQQAEVIARSLDVGRLEVSLSRLPQLLREALVSAARDSSLFLIDDGGRSRPLTSALREGKDIARTGLPTVADAISAARDSLKFFGHQPATRRAAMPAPESRRMWWDILAEYGRFHSEACTAAASGEFDWLEVRPELVISTMLKSLVQPGFEMVPRVMGFPEKPPLHVKWIRGRYHFRADAFAEVWEAIVDSTWDPAYMSNLMRRVRASYDRLAEVLVLFPADGRDLEAISSEQIAALVTSWWTRWVEFFALSWFLQAQGDDVLYPFIDQVVAANLSSLEATMSELAWPRSAELLAPTTPVLSGDYMADVDLLRAGLLHRQLSTVEDALAVMGRGDAPDLVAMVDRHLAKWGWMRDRDLIFEPWDSARRIIDTALKTQPHQPADYAENRKRNLSALAMHSDLVEAEGLAPLLNHAVRFFHDLSVERENHHVLWLKYSYPLRQLLLEVERRLLETWSLEPGDIWFMQVPELLGVVRDLSQPEDIELIDRVSNRRIGFEYEARFNSPDGPAGHPEDDYM